MTEQSMQNSGGTRGDQMHNGQNTGHFVAEHRRSRRNASCKLGKIQGANRADKMHCGQETAWSADRIEDGQWAENRMHTLHSEQDIGCRMHTHRVHPAQYRIDKGNPYLYFVASSMMVLTGYFMPPRKEGKETTPVTQL